MVCSSIIFIPGVMIYEFIKAWKATRTTQLEVSTMPHYLRMLTYARQPDTEWGPAKDVNRFGRYKPKKEEFFNDDDDSSLNSANIFRIKL